MGNLKSGESLEFTEEILQLLKQNKYNFVVCTPVNSENAPDYGNENNLVILFTPVKEIIDGFMPLKDFNNESFLLTLDEVEDEIYNINEPYLKFVISREAYETLLRH